MDGIATQAGMVRRGGFDPLSLAPALWLSDTGSSAGTWPDLSGNGRDATQATGGDQPSIVSAALNGRQVRRFDGSSDNMVLSSSRGISRNIAGATLSLVLKATSGSSGDRCVFSINTGTTASRLLLGVDNASNPASWHYGGRRLDADSGDFSQSGSDYLTSAFYVVTVQLRYSAAQKEIFVNGTSSHLDASFQTAGSTQNTDSAYDPRIGRYSDTSAGFFQGDIAEVLFFPSALAGADRQLIERYLGAKYGISVA